MATIEINIEKLDAKIQELDSLHQRMLSDDLKPPMRQGEGNTIDELDSIANRFCKIDKSLETLILNTISYLIKVKNDFIQSEEEASKKIEGK